MTTANTTGTRSSPLETPGGEPDPKAVAVARAVLEREAPDFAILFGSRARGDWDDESDIASYW